MRGKDFFKQEKTRLGYYRRKLVAYLEAKDYTAEQIELYTEAYDYFCENPTHYDGATIVKDLAHIGSLDINAMLHDYHYLSFNVASNVVYKWKSDFIYAKEMERHGRGYLSWIRFLGVTLSGIYYIPKSIIERGFMKKEKKKEFLKIYKTLLVKNGSIN